MSSIPDGIGPKQGRSRARPAGGEPPLTVEVLAAHFKLHVDDLPELGVHNLADGTVGITYYGMTGEVLFVRKRLLFHGLGQRFKQPYKVPCQPYGLWKLDLARHGGVLWLVQGESDCWALWHHGYPALGIPGVETVGCLLAEHLTGIDRVIISEESAKDGPQFVENLRRRLAEIGYTGKVYVVRMPEPHKDPADLHRADPGAFLRNISNAVHGSTPIDLPPSLPLASATDGQATGAKPGGAAPNDAKEPTPPAASRLVQVVLDADFELFHDPGGQAYARAPASKPRAVFKISDREFRHRVAGLWSAREGRTLQKTVREEAFEDLERRACVEGSEHPVYVRVGSFEDKLYLDLGDREWRAVEIWPGGWRVVSDPPVRFRRSREARPLPVPQRGATLDLLRHYVNVPNEDDWTLLLAWIVAAFRPGLPSPVLVITGQQGSAKSTLGRVLKRLIDPHKAELLREPRSIQDLFIAAQSCRLLGLDNLSRIDAKLSDALCSIATGGQYAARRLYTSDEQEILSALNPVFLTSIEDVVNRSDLLSRSLVLDLPPLPEGPPWTEAELWREFSIDLPRILGAVLDALAGALRELPTARFHGAARMADFAHLGAALEVPLGWEAGRFSGALARNREDVDELALGASVTAGPLLTFLERKGGCWEGTAQELLDGLNAVAGEAAARADNWPKTAQHLGDRLKRLAPNLRHRGIGYEQRRDTGGNRTRLIRLTCQGAGGGSSSPLG
jgi:hypothetical protein